MSSTDSSSSWMRGLATLQMPLQAATESINMHGTSGADECSLCAAPLTTAGRLPMTGRAYRRLMIQADEAEQLNPFL